MKTVTIDINITFTKPFTGSNGEVIDHAYESLFLRDG